MWLKSDKNTCSWSEYRDSSHLHCSLVLLLHEKGSSAGKKELAFLSMHELWALTSKRGLAPTPRASTQSNMTSSLHQELKRCPRCLSVHSRRWPPTTAVWSLELCSQSGTTAKAINHNRKSQGLETSVSGVAVTLANWFSLSNSNSSVAALRWVKPLLRRSVVIITLCFFSSVEFMSFVKLSSLSSVS